MSVWKRNENEFAPPPTAAAPTPPPVQSPAPPPVSRRRRPSRRGASGLADASGCRHHRAFHRHQG